MVETWKDINGYDGYQVSNLGRVRSLDKPTKNKVATFIKKGKILKNIINNKGYEYIVLKQNNNSKKVYIHRLVAETFIPNEENKKEVNHIDCNPLNNNVNNLEWVSHKENMKYMSKLGRSDKKGEWLKKIIKSNSKYWKPVVKIDKNTNKQLKVYSYLNEVKKDGYRPGDVCRCCQGIRKTHNNYKWGYYEDS